MVYADFTPADLERNAEDLAREFNRTGLLVFPRLLARDERFLSFSHDLSRLFGMLGDRAGVSFPEGATLDAQVSILAERDRAAIGVVYDLGTHPNKLYSAMLVKTHPAFLTFARAVFGADALLATPALSDTLHIFPPGDENFRYNLPVHQDYPYLLQSPRQFTAWIGMGARHEGVGGITVWAGSHRAGVRETRVGEFGHLESIVSADELAGYEPVEITSDVGDVVMMNAHLLHVSNRNTTADRSRVVQLFRYADLADDEATSYDWASVVRQVKPKALFAELYANKLVQPA